MAGYLTYEIVILFFVVVQSLCCVQLFATPRAAARHTYLSFTISQSLLKFMSIQSEMPSNHLIVCHPLLPRPSIFLSIRVFSNESTLCIRWPKDWSFLFSISLSSEYSGLVSLMNWFPTLGFQRADWFHSGFLFWFSLPSQLLLTTFQLLFWTTVTRSNPRNSDTERNESSPSCWDNLRQCRNVTIHGPKNKLFCLVANQSSHSQHMCLKENRKWTQRISQHV